tara:strand:+ start:2480 stop:3871 length:1392 start_codon:yes stop_codon:yes gene_type:complete
MGADKALLDTFEKLYSSRGANYAEALSKPLAKAAADIAVRREKLRKEIDDHVSLYPPEADITDVPVDFVSNELRPVLSGERDLYSDYAEQFVRARTREEKNKARALMDRSLNTVNSLNADIKAYKSLKGGGFFDADNNLISEQAFTGKQNDKTQEIFGVFTGKTPLTIDKETKRLGFFSEKENRFVPVNEFEKFLPPQKAEKQAKALNTILDQASKGQIPNNDDAIEVALKQFEASLGEGNRVENIKSIVFDDLLVPGFKLIDLKNDEFKPLLDRLDSDDENIRVDAEEEITDMMRDNFRNLVRERAGIFERNQLSQAQQKIDLQTQALRQRQENQLKLNKQFNYKAAYDDPMYARKFLIDQNPNYELQGTTEQGIGKEKADITTEKGFNANAARMRELLKIVNDKFDIQLGDGEVSIGPKVVVTEDAEGNPLPQPVTQIVEEASFKSIEDFSDYIQRQLNLI